MPKQRSHMYITPAEVRRVTMKVKTKSAEYKYIVSPQGEEQLRGYMPFAQVYVEMSPGVFLRGLGETLGREELVSQKNVERIKAKIEAGQELDPLFLDYDPYRNEVISHEGRHRATAAKQLGIDRIPVIVYLYDPKGWHDKIDRFGRVYDQTHYVRRDELTKEKILQIIDRFDAKEINAPLRRRPGWVTERIGPHTMVTRYVLVRSYRRRR